jgi:2-polyprenyl-3-methyl-5-hydroxy-6-metoxy-1,4-benzoquinol methylase
MAGWSTDEYGPTGWGKLFRDKEDPARFRSVGAWPNDQVVAEWRASEGFKQRLAKIRELLEEMGIRTFDLSAEVGHMEAESQRAHASSCSSPTGTRPSACPRSAADGERLATMTSATAPELKRSKAEKFWDRLARTWAAPATGPEQTDTKVLAKTRPYLKVTDTVLDFGCAKGSVDLRLAGAVKAIHGIDISSNMIAAAREAAVAREVTNVSFAHAAIFDDSLERESFDVVLAFAVLHLLEDAPEVLLRIGELLKPGGLLISATPCLGEKGTLPVRSVMLLVRLAGRLGLMPPVWRPTIGELRGLMQAAGLVTVEVDELVHSTSEYFVVARKTP